MGHAEPVIADGQRAGILVDLYGDTEIRVAFDQRRLGNRPVAQPVAGIRRVRNQLANKDFLFAVQRIGDDIQQAAHLRLEGMRFAAGFRFRRFFVRFFSRCHLYCHHPQSLPAAYMC